MPQWGEERERLNRRAVLQIAGSGIIGGVSANRFSSSVSAVEDDLSRGSSVQSQGEGEPNDGVSDAAYIEPGTVHGTIGPCCIPLAGDDDDWFTFDADRGAGVRVEFSENPPAIKRLLGPSETVLDVGDHFTRSVSATVQQTGRQYLHLGDPPGGANGAYTFRLAVGDERAGDDTQSDSGGGSASHSLDVTKSGTPEGLGVFAVAVSDRIVQSNASEAVIKDRRAIDWVGPESGTDRLMYTGEITNFLLKGEANVLLDGNPVDPNSLGVGQSEAAQAGSTTASNRLAVTKQGKGEGLAAFTLASSGGLEATDSFDGVIKGNSALDWVGPRRGTDEIRFGGEITDFLLKGNATVYLNGQRVNPDELG